MRVNGFTVPNCVVDDYLCVFPGLALKCYLLIVRKTVGWQKLKDSIPITQFITATGKERRSVINALNWLDDHDLIIRDQVQGVTTAYELNRDCSGEKLRELKASASAEKCTGSKHTSRSKPVQKTARVTGADNCTGQAVNENQPVQITAQDQCSLLQGPVQIAADNRCKKLHPSKDTIQNHFSKDTIQNQTDCSAPENGAPLPPPETPPKKGRPKAKTHDVWAAYSSAYLDRYGTEPLRNAKTNKCLSNFIDQVGADEAPHIAAFYLQHNDQWFVRRSHAVTELLSNAESLRTQWKTGTRVTTRTAQAVERKSNNQQQLENFRNRQGANS